ncbi:MAG: glutathione peroxidase [SAR324 cluster bacterium]|uniref:Glutathione peroxidase n=1 Tax=SAR324 cluster bacterium TaxID=2024889 RepID=A0A2A4SUW3_9DELT|nr:MAG: glutathione peroxidase [SAR324 cluster bacterium]
MSDIYNFTCTMSNGEEKAFSNFRGKVLLIVNTASKCGFTPQFEGLEKLYLQYSEQGLEVLGFPCNQFKKQDPGTDKEIVEFCRLNYGVSFQMFSKIEVNGENTHPLYEFLKKQAPGALGSKGIKWNFTKFLVDREGNVLRRYASLTKPESIAQDISKLLGT